VRNVVVYSHGLCFASACALTDLDALAVELAVNDEVPTGIAAPWRISEDAHFANGAPNPSPCEKDETRKHWLLSC
jgi:hypothetical protein